MCVNLVTQHAMRMRITQFSTAALPDLHFSALFHKGHDLKEIVEHKSLF
jgi:hypothetical protein